MRSVCFFLLPFLLTTRESFHPQALLKFVSSYLLLLLLSSYLLSSLISSRVFTYNKTLTIKKGQKDTPQPMHRTRCPKFYRWLRHWWEWNHRILGSKALSSLFSSNGTLSHDPTTFSWQRSDRYQFVKRYTILVQHKRTSLQRVEPSHKRRRELGDSQEAEIP